MEIYYCGVFWARAVKPSPESSTPGSSEIGITVFSNVLLSDTSESMHLGGEAVTADLKSMDEFERYAASLYGHAISKVIYWDFRPESGDPLQRHASCDTTEFAVELHLDDGKVLSVAWDAYGQLNDHGLRILAGRFPDVRGVAPEQLGPWEMTRDERWAAFIGRPITTVSVYRLWDPDANALCEPLDLVLGVAGGARLFVSAGRVFPDEKFVVVSGDNIVIVFDEGTARKFQLGPYAPESFKRGGPL